MHVEDADIWGWATKKKLQQNKSCCYFLVLFLDRTVHDANEAVRAHSKAHI